MSPWCPIYYILHHTSFVKVIDRRVVRHSKDSVKAYQLLPLFATKKHFIIFLKNTILHAIKFPKLRVSVTISAFCAKQSQTIWHTGFYFGSLNHISKVIAYKVYGQHQESSRTCKIIGQPRFTTS